MDYRQAVIGGAEQSEVLTFAKRFARCRTRPEPQIINRAWTVLCAATDLRDEETMEIARRVIDAELLGRSSTASDRRIVERYFR